MSKKQSKLKSSSFLSFLIAIVVISTLSIAHYTRGPLRVIDYDISGYYAYLPAIFIYDDLKELNWRSEMIEKYHFNGLDDCAPERESGVKVIKYPVGMAISYFPGFAMAHLYASLSNSASDGYSQPYHLGLIIIGWLYMLIGLWYLRKLLSIYFEDWIVALTLLIVALGTNYYIYAGSHTMMSHSFLFMLFALVIYHTTRWYKNPNWSRIIGIGILLGLITITRPTEILLSLVVLFWGVYNIDSLRLRIKLLTQYKLHLLTAVVGTAIVISIQLFYWKYASGDWIVYSYKDEGFTWDGRYLRECFIGFRKGWLIYTPVMLLGIIGLYPMYKQKNTSGIAKPIILFLIISTYIIFSWDNYWYGGGFGQRAMISSYVLFSFSIAALLQSLTSKGKWLKYLTGVFILLCIWLNIFQSFQAQIWGGFETNHMTKKYYFKIFGERNINPDWKVLLDNADAKLGEVETKEMLFNVQFENELGSMERPYEGTKTIKIVKGLYTLLDETISTLKEGQRLRAKVMVSGSHRVWNRGTMSNLHIQLYSKGELVRDQSVRLHDVSRDPSWKPIQVDIKIRRNDIDQIKVLAWSSDENQFVYLDDLKVSLI